VPRPPRACLVALLLAACHRPSPAPPRDAAPVDAARPATDAPTGRPDTSNDATADAITDAAITDAAAADVVATAPGAVDAACSALTAASLARWDALVRGRRESVPVLYAADRRAEVRRRWECVRVAGGAWALALEARSLAVVFVRPDGSTARVTPRGCAVDPVVPGFQGTAMAPQPGAGASPSVVVTCDNGRGAVVSATADGLATSPLPFGDVRVQLSDLDRDGRLDVSTVAEAPGAVVFVAHALPAGGFSMDDEVARIALRGQCPERPSALLVPVPADAPEEDDPNDDDDLARRVACARVWGLSASAIASLLDRDDAGVRTSLPRASLLAIASRRPPQRLRPAALPPMAEVTPAEPVVDAGVTADPVVPAASGVVTAACGAAAARVRRLTEAEVTRAGESLTDAGTDTIDGRPVLRRMGIVRRSLGRCVPTVGGAWVLALRSIERGEGEGGTLRFRVRWAADFVTTAGARVDGPERTALVDEGCDHDELDAFAGSDIDGDGRGELAFAGTHYWCGDGDGDAPIPVTVLTARGDRVAPYAPFAVVGAVESFTDFDRDGRLDFVDAERWGRIVCDPAAVGVDDSPGPTALWHALPDGTFSRTDAVARAYLRRGSCAQPPRRFFPAASAPGSGERFDGSPALFAAVCAMAHGWSAERVQLRAIDELRTMGPARARFACNDLEWLSWRLLVGLPGVANTSTP
jgi:hypothetical protein